MRKLLKYALTTALLFAFLSVDFTVGDLRYDIDGHTMRHWNIVPVSIELKPACALVKSGGYPCGSTASSTYTLTGPNSGVINATTSNFTVRGAGTGTTLITPNDSTHGGVFNPATVNLANTNPVTFTYTPLQAGTFNIATTNGGTLTNPSPISFTSPNIAPGYPGMTAGSWVASHDGTITTAQAGDPFGGANAVKIGEGTATDYHTIITGSGFAITTGHNYEVTIMVKVGTGSRQLELQFVDGTNFASGDDMVIDPVACTVSTGTWGGGIVNSSATRTSNLGSGWCLAQFNGSLDVTPAAIQLFLVSGGVEVYAGDGASNLFVYGATVQ